MRLTEITAEEFKNKLKDPFMGRVVAGVERVVSKLEDEWKLVLPPTYDHSINDPNMKVNFGDTDVIVFQISRSWPQDIRGRNERQVEKDVWNAADAIESVFGAGTDDDQDWGKNGEEIRTITTYVFEDDKTK